jgi:Holliday junction resolvase-like predicted endonuclease
VPMASNDSDPVIRFVLDGQSYEWARSDVEARLSGVRPRALASHGVRIHGTWYPVRQAFEIGSRIPAAQFNSHTARRHLASLGFEVTGDIQHRDGFRPVKTQTPAGGSTQREPAALGDGPWYTEARVQAALVSALVADGWHIVSQADTATKERGIDVVASRGNVVAGVEVKGFPTTTYADPRRSGEVKPTQPSTQAGHWYSQAVVAAMRLRTRHPEFLSVIALPDYPRYRTLFAETRTSLDAAGIHLWWVHNSGTVEGLPAQR